MTVELYLNPDADGYGKLQTDLRQELAALSGVTYSEAKAPAPANVLTVEHDVLKFILEHPSTVLLAKAMIELVHSILDRRKVSPDPKTPPTVIVIDGRSLRIPSSQQKEAQFIKALESEEIQGEKVQGKRSTSPVMSNKKKSKKR